MQRLTEPQISHRGLFAVLLEAFSSMQTSRTSYRLHSICGTIASATTSPVISKLDHGILHRDDASGLISCPRCPRGRYRCVLFLVGWSTALLRPCVHLQRHVSDRRSSIVPFLGKAYTPLDTRERPRASLSRRSRLHLKPRQRRARSVGIRQSCDQ